MPQIIYLKDKNDRVILMNQAASVAFNCSTREARNTYFHKLLTEKQLQTYSQESDKAVLDKNKKAFIPEEMFVDHYGDTLIFQTLKIPYRLPLSEEFSLLIISSDITEQVITTEALMESERKLSEAHKIANIGTFDLNIETQKIILSEELFRIINQNPGNFSGHYADYVKLIHPDDRIEYESLVNESIKNHKGYHVEYRILKNNQSVVHLSERSGIIVINKTLRLVGTLQDITQFKLNEHQLSKAKEKAEDSDAFKSMILSIISQEARIPLTSILGFAELLAEKENPDSEKNRFASIIEESGKNLLHILDDLVDSAKIDSGDFSVKLQDYSVTELFDNVKIESEKDLKSHIELQFNLPDNLAYKYVKTDKARFIQAIVILLRNIQKFLNTGIIEVGCKSLNLDSISFYVQNSWVILPKEKVNLVFTLEKEFKNYNSYEHSTTGLSIRLARKIIELLGSSLKNENGGKHGIQFSFDIPVKIIVENSMVKRIHVPYQNLEWSARTILIAEDNDNNYLFIHEALKRTGVQLIRAVNGAQALEIFKKSKKNDGSVNLIDLVLMDIKMPVLNGHEATQGIREIDKRIPVVALSAYALPKEIEKSLSSGCNAYIFKPIQMNELLETIHFFLNQNTNRSN